MGDPGLICPVLATFHTHIVSYQDYHEHNKCSLNQPLNNILCNSFPYCHTYTPVLLKIK